LRGLSRPGRATLYPALTPPSSRKLHSPFFTCCTAVHRETPLPAFEFRIGGVRNALMTVWPESLFSGHLLARRMRAAAQSPSDAKATMQSAAERALRQARQKGKKMERKRPPAQP
jgi:hypothetical protein